MIEIQKLLYFVAIVDANFSLSEASKNLSITQPTLSLTIDTLEKYYNQKLLEKKKNKYVSLTAHGELLYNDAKKMIEQSNKTYLKITRIEDYIGELSIAIPPVTQPIVCSQVITQFKKKYPNIKLNIVEDGAYIGTKKILQGELDFGFLTIFQTLPELTKFEIFESDIVAMFKSDHPLAQKEYLTPYDVEQYDIIGLDESFTIHQMIDIYFNSRNSSISYFYKTSRWDFGMEMISNNKYDFIALLPSPILNIYSSDKITYRKFKDEFKWKVALAYKKDRLLRKESILFIEFVKEFFKVN